LGLLEPTNFKVFEDGGTAGDAQIRTRWTYDDRDPAVSQSQERMLKMGDLDEEWRAGGMGREGRRAGGDGLRGREGEQ
jgi:hypothetical protein